MLAAMVACKQFPERYLPVVADTVEELCAEIHAVQEGLYGVIDQRIAEMAPRTNFRTEKPAVFLGLNTGIHVEMSKRAEVNTPMAMADRLIAAKDLFYPDLVSELLPKSVQPGLAFDVLRDTRQCGQTRKRLAERLGKGVPERTPRLVTMGRMLAHFTLTQEKLRHFID